MGILDPSSLSTTVDRLSDVFFMKSQADPLQLAEAVRWIASRQGQVRSYAGTIAPTPLLLATFFGPFRKFILAPPKSLIFRSPYFVNLIWPNSTV